MPNKEIAQNLLDREIKTMEIYLATKVLRSSATLEEYVQIRLLQGATKKALLIELERDLMEGGRVFGEFRNSVRSTARGSLARLRDIGVASEIGVDEKWRWVTVEDKSVCKDCGPRHNQVKTWEEWEEAGLPRTGATVCRENCRCILNAVNETEKIKRAKRK